MFINSGDILFSASQDASFNPGGPGGAGGFATPSIVTTLPTVGGQLINVRAGDILLFRPTSADYSTGEYFKVANLEEIYGNVPQDYELSALALVEQETIVGDQILNAGDFLFSDSENSSDILRLQLDSVGSATVGTISTFVEGSDVGIDNRITGLEFVESRTTAGGEVIEGGSILVSVDAAESVGSNEELSVQAQDIFTLELDSTSVTGSASAEASLFFDGSDVGATPDQSEAGIDAVSLLGNPDPDDVLTLSASPVEIDESVVHRFAPSDFVTEVSASDLEAVIITSLPNSTMGQLLFRNEEVTVGQVIEAKDLGFLVYEPVFNLNFDFDQFTYRVSSTSGISGVASLNLAVNELSLIHI